MQKEEKRTSISVFEEYKGFTVGSKMIDPITGIKDPTKTIDRVNPDKGYSLDNMQVLTLHQNSRKRYTDYYNSPEGQAELNPEEVAFWANKKEKLEREIEEDLPF